MMKWQQTQQQQGHPLTLVEAALMVETGSYRMYDAIIVTTCSTETQLSRLIERNQVSKKQHNSGSTVKCPSQKEAIADVVIHNDGTLSDLHIKTTNGWKQLINKLHPAKKHRPIVLVV